ncbi:uncharacterized protein LOC121377304 [Gigantopelta aegis]|uniref:uncharacterized protein LOC121377304 n=1 Tax=Gigantopelta aegis TaxID=1735272 RepID=UPI001B88B735|nr:uncharacterized protein LOC121377304 [Gigantopelta aegis]
MSGVNKNYLPSRRIMPVYTTVSPPVTGAPVPAFPYDAPVTNSTPPTSGAYAKIQVNPKLSPTAPYTKGPEFPYDPPDMGKTAEYHYATSLQNGTKSSPTSATSAAAAVAAAAGFNRLSESVKSGAMTMAGYSRMQEFPYGLSGVAMPNYNYSSELYSYVSNGFPRKSRMCSYCGKVFTRSTTRRYHEKRCPLLRAAGSLMKTSEAQHTTAGSSSNSNANSSSTTIKPSFSDTSLSSYCSNASLPPISPHAPYYAHFPPAYASTSMSAVASAIDQNRNSVSDIKTEPCDPADLSTSMSTAAAATTMVTGSQSASGEVSTTRFTPEYESGSLQPTTRMLFSPTTTTTTHHGRGASMSPISMAAESLPRPGSNDTGETDIYRSDDTENVNDLEHTADDSSYRVIVASSAVAAAYQRRVDHESQSALYISESGNGSYEHLSQGKNGDTGDVEEDEDDEKNSVRTNSVVDRHSTLLAHAHHAHSLANRCSICGKVFETARQLHAHEQLHTKFKPYACRFCGQRFIKVSMRIAHERVHIGEKPYVCAICGLTFTRKYSVRLHMRRRHTEGPCLCRYCGKTIYNLHSLKTHLLAHNLPKSEKESLFYLNISPLTEKGNLSSEHMSSIPSNGQQKEGGTGEDGDDGMEMLGKKGGGESVEQEWCKLCEKVFPKSFMRYHERIHADQKPYECPTCKKRFGYKNNMKSHMKLHEGIKPYQCHVCGAKFTRGSTLRRHARRHGIFSDSVWDFFVQKRKAAKKEEKEASLQQASVQGRSSSPDVSSTRSIHVDAATTAANPDSSRNYDSIPYTSPTEDGSGSLYNSYTPGAVAAAGATMSNVAHSIYYTYPTTSPFSVEYSSYIPSQAPQADALNLSIHDNVGKSKPIVRHLDNVVRHPDDNVAQDVHHHHARIDDISDPDPDSPDDGHTNMLMNNGHDIGVQVNLCCCDQPPPLLTVSSLLAFNPRLMSPEEADGSQTSRTSPVGLEGSQASRTSPSRTSPSLVSAEVNMQESMSTLLLSGRLFRCSHCECFFSEYAMYRIHQKLHAHNADHPFMCPTCGEDCHDRMYFSLHLLEHLR